MSIFSALFFLILWGAVQSASIPSKNVRLLKIKVPLELEFCKQLGYTETSAINFMKQTQSVARNDHLYKALVMLDMTGCSELLRAYTCAIYGPPVISKYSTALPPCRSLCKKVKKACWTPVVALLSKNGKIWFQYFCVYHLHSHF